MTTIERITTPRIRIFDTTLRDGEQSPGCSMSPPQKLVMARALDELGVDIIETGFPASSQSDREAMAMIGRELRRPSLSLAVLSRCLQADIETSARALEAAANPRLHVFLSTSPLHREHKLRMTREQVLESVRKHVSLARSYIDDVEFSAEDATRTELDYLIEVSRVAIAAGATTINLPDTVGFTTPEEIRAMFQQVIAGVADVPNAANVIFSQLAGRHRRRCTPGRVHHQRHRRARRQLFAGRDRDGAEGPPGLLRTGQFDQHPTHRRHFAAAAASGRHAGTAQQGHRRCQRVRP